MHDDLDRCTFITCDRSLDHEYVWYYSIRSTRCWLRDAEDSEIFEAAKAQSVILMTKDSDFPDLVDRLGSPPQVIWLTCGNTSNARLREILIAALPQALELLRSGEALVEISGN